MGVPEETKSKLEQLKKDQETLKAQLAELDTYLMKKYGAGKKGATTPNRTYAIATRSYPAPGYSAYPRRPQPDYSQYTAQELAEMRDLLAQSIQNSRRLTEKFDYLLDALISSLDDMNSEDVDKTIRIIAESQAHMLDNLTETRKALEELETQAVTREDLQQFTKEYKERYAELARRINELMSKIEQPAVMDAISALQAQISQIGLEVKELEENVKSGGKTKELIDKTNQLTTRIQSLEERLKTITDLVQSMSQHVYASEAAMAHVSNLEAELSDLKQTVQTLQNAVMQETDMNKVEIEKALKEISDVSKSVSGVGELVEIEKANEKKFEKFEKEMEELEERLAKMNAVEERLEKLEKKLDKIERFVDVYPIGEVQELSAIKSEISRIKPNFPTEHFSRLEERIEELEKRLDKVTRERDAEKNEEAQRLRDLVARLDRKLDEMDRVVKEYDIQGFNEKLQGIDQTVEDMRKTRRLLERARSRGDVEELISIVQDLDKRMSMIQKRIEELNYAIHNGNPKSEINTDLAKVEGMLDYAKSIKSTKEKNETVKALQETLDNLDTKLNRIDKEWNKPKMREIKKATKEIESKVSAVEDRMVLERRLEATKEYKRSIDRIKNLERLVKLGVIQTKAVKRELGKLRDELIALKEKLSVDENYKPMARKVSTIINRVEKAIRSRHPEEEVPKIRKALTAIETHPAQKLDRAVSGLFILRKEIEERNKFDREAQNRLKDVIKSIRTVEKEVKHEDIKNELLDLRNELKVIMDKLKKRPGRHLGKLEKIEDKLIDLKDRLDQADREAALIFKIEDELEKKEEEINELNRKLSAGSIDGKEVAERIKRINGEILELRKRLAHEIVEINNVVKSLSAIKAMLSELVPVNAIKEELDLARSALKKKDIKEAKKHLKRARAMASSSGDNEMLEKVEDLERRLADIGAEKKEKLERIESKHKTGVFSRVTANLHGLVHATNREAPGKEHVSEKSVGKLKEHVSGLAILVDEVVRGKANPEALRKARKSVEDVERQIAHVNPVPAPPVKEIEKKLMLAEKEAEVLNKEIAKAEKMAEDRNKTLAQRLKGTWIMGLVARREIKATKEDLGKMKKALEESERKHEERAKKLKQAKLTVDKHSVPLEFIVMEFIEGMKSGERVKVSEMARKLRVNTNELLNALRKMSGNFRLEGIGLLSGLVRKEPEVIRI